MTIKRFITIVVTLASLLVAESNADAQLLKNLLKKSNTETKATVTPTSNGKAAGAALKSLYSQYKTDGKLDMSNLSNIMNLTTLATNVQGLKGQTDKSAFYKDFASGLILGSGSLVTAKNSSNVMSGLTSLVNNVDLSGLIKTKAAETTAAVSEKTAATAATAATALSNASDIADSVTNILNIFKK